MKRQVKYFVPLIILLIITIIGVILSGALFNQAMKAMKVSIGGIFGGVIIIAFFAIALLASLVCSVILLPISVKSCKLSEKKTFPLICIILSTIIALAAISIIILAISFR